MWTPSSRSSARTSACVSGSGWHKGISSAVRFAAMMPAMRAASKGSPFGVRPARSAATVSADISTRADATARRAVCALPDVSTIATRPSASTCESSFIASALQLPFEEVRGRRVGAEPVAVEEEVVHVVGEDDLLELDVLLAQTAHEVYGLREGDVALVVAVDEEHGRAPLLDGADGRRFERDLLRVAAVVVDPRSARDALRPVVHAVHVYARGKEVGVARQSQRRQVASVRAAPEPDALVVDVRAAPQEARCGDDILVLGSPARATLRGH